MSKVLDDPIAFTTDIWGIIDALSTKYENYMMQANTDKNWILAREMRHRQLAIEEFIDWLRRHEEDPVTIRGVLTAHDIKFEDDPE